MDSCLSEGYKCDQLRPGFEFVSTGPFLTTVITDTSILPLVFVITKIPFNHILRKCIRGYKFTKSQEKINQLMYMNDIKIFAINEKLVTMTQTIKIYSQDIGMEFCIEKCAMLIVTEEKLFKRIELPNQERIRTLGEKEKYKSFKILDIPISNWIQLPISNSSYSFKNRSKCTAYNWYHRPIHVIRQGSSTFLSFLFL